MSFHDGVSTQQARFRHKAKAFFGDPTTYRLIPYPFFKVPTFFYIGDHNPKTRNPKQGVGYDPPGTTQKHSDGL